MGLPEGGGSTLLDAMTMTAAPVRERGGHGRRGRSRLQPLPRAAGVRWTARVRKALSPAQLSVQDLESTFQS
jgi:hypothetical protein